MDLWQKLALAERVAREAGARLRARPDFRVEQKAVHDYVTDMDRQTEQLIRERILAACPEDDFFGEEFGETSGKRGQWVVDPIDGTTNYIHDLPSYAVSIAYRMDGELVLGCVYCPAQDEMFLAHKGGGATRNGQSIRVSDTKDPQAALVAVSFSHRHASDRARMMALIGAMHELNDMRRSGSAAYDLCMVACGRIDGYVELRLNLYDIGAGIVILREAGGTVSGWPGEADCAQTGNVLAGNGKINGYLAGKIAGL